VVTVRDIDRLTRNLADWNAFEKACLRHGVRLCAFTGGDLDRSTPRVLTTAAWRRGANAGARGVLGARLADGGAASALIVTVAVRSSAGGVVWHHRPP
jgi:hypothetical protein